MSKAPGFERVFYPSDFTPASEIAFAHALMIALKSKAMFQLMHVDSKNEAEWDQFPSIHETLQRWKVLPAGSSDAHLEHLGLDVSKIIASCRSPVQACLDFFDVNDVDLIVLSVHQREGIVRWLEPLVGERISAGSKQSTLFIPVGKNGFVSKADGSIALRNILIPIVKKPRAEEGVRFVQQLIHNLDIEFGSVTLLHVGQSETMPFVQHPLNGGWAWNRVRVEGERTDSILQVAEDIEADLIVMTTDGPDRFLDGLRGTTSERVLRRAECPVAVIPVESAIE